MNEAWADWVRAEIALAMSGVTHEERVEANPAPVESEPALGMSNGDAGKSETD